MINVIRDFFNYVLSPLFLMTVTPVFVLSMWDVNNMLGYMPGNEYSWNVTFIFIIFQYIMLVMSDVEITGPITTKNDMGVYKGNGLAVYLFTMFIYVYLTILNMIDPIKIFDNLGYFFSTFIILGYIVSTCLYIKGWVFPNSVDCQRSGFLLFDYYWGIELHPRIFGIDIKQLTNCRFGMMLWPLLLLTYMYKQYFMLGYVSNSLLCSCALQLVYITKFFYWEDGYFKTIDIMVDKAGFYICWGCISFLPLFYTSHSLYLVYHPVDLDMYSLLSIYIIGLSSIFLNYYVDYERMIFRESEGRIKTFGSDATYIKAKYLDNYKLEKTSLLLTSGFWGMSRHINYFFEILSAFMWSVPAQFESVYPYYYVIFLTILLVHRERRDDDRCSEKYGKYWEIYKKSVPYRIIKYIY